MEKSDTNEAKDRNLSGENWMGPDGTESGPDVPEDWYLSYGGPAPVVYEISRENYGVDRGNGAIPIQFYQRFQKIYRPEIYNANAVAGECFRPSLKHPDYSLTRIDYDREERSQLAVNQGLFAEECFIQPYQSILNDWSASFPR